MSRYLLPMVMGLSGLVVGCEKQEQLAERKLSELESASGEAWKDLASGVDKAVEDLKQPSSARKRPGASPAAR